ncbi:MAG: hypothetical protein AVDCRST_MAG89-4342, partial [uncultured Gemmatimonadetes bacterium]
CDTTTTTTGRPRASAPPARTGA